MDLTPEHFLADLGLSLDAALVVLIAQRRRVSIVRLLLHARHLLADIGQAHLEMRCFDVARRSADAARLSSQISEMLAVFLRRMTLAELSLSISPTWFSVSSRLYSFCSSQRSQ